MRCVLLFVVLASVSGCGGEQPQMAGNKWARALREPDRKLRKKAAFTLGNIGQSDPAVLKALLGALRDPDAAVRCEAILALVKCGREAPETIPAIAEVQEHDPDAKARMHACKALQSLGRAQ
jgi:hypothetical protein